MKTIVSGLFTAIMLTAMVVSCQNKYLETPPREIYKAADFAVGWWEEQEIKQPGYKGIIEITQKSTTTFILTSYWSMDNKWNDINGWVKEDPFVYDLKVAEDGNETLYRSVFNTEYGFALESRIAFFEDKVRHHDTLVMLDTSVDGHEYGEGEGDDNGRTHTSTIIFWRIDKPNYPFFK